MLHCVCVLFLFRYGRTDVMTLGKFSLNLSNCPVFDHTPFPSLVNELIEQLVTKVMYYIKFSCYLSYHPL